MGSTGVLGDDTIDRRVAVARQIAYGPYGPYGFAEREELLDRMRAGEFDPGIEPERDHLEDLVDAYDAGLLDD